MREIDLNKSEIKNILEAKVTVMKEEINKLQEHLREKNALISTLRESGLKAEKEIEKLKYHLGSHERDGMRMCTMLDRLKEINPSLYKTLEDYERKENDRHE